MKRNKILSIITLSLLLSIQILLAQSDHFVSVSEKVLFFDFSDLNTATSEFGYSAIDNKALEFGLGINVQCGTKISADLTFLYALGFEESNQSLKSSKFNGIGFMSEFQYSLTAGTQYSISPLMGIGVRKYQLSFVNHAHNTLGSILGQPNEHTYVFSNFGTFIDVGLEGQKNFLLKKIKLALRLKAGYRIDSGNWKFENINNVEDSIAKLSAPFIGLGMLIGKL